MGFLGWMAATGGLLLLMSLASGWISRGPVTSFALYLIAGILCDPGYWMCCGSILPPTRLWQKI